MEDWIATKTCPPPAFRRVLTRAACSPSSRIEGTTAGPGPGGGGVLYLIGRNSGCCWV